jgi:chromosome partitioning protein
LYLPFEVSILRKIAVLNQKGGVGKTTTVVNVAAALAANGQRVVVIDLDPQAHLTIHFGVEPESIEAGSYKVLTHSAKLEDGLMSVRDNVWLLGANINLVGAESELVSVVGRETILREAVREVEDRFDYLIIDCPPSLGLLTLNALAACDEVLIPLQPHFLALQGFGKLLQTVGLVNKRINPNLKVKGILLCMFDSRTSLSSEVRTDIEKFLNNARGGNSAWSQAQLLPIHVRRNVKLAEAPSYGKTIFEYEQNCHGAEDYKKVAEFLSNQPMSEEFGGAVQSESEVSGKQAQQEEFSNENVQSEQQHTCQPTASEDEFPQQQSQESGSEVSQETSLSSESPQAETKPVN